MGLTHAVYNQDILIFSNHISVSYNLKPLFLTYVLCHL
jgi:hypothetical protein